MEPSKDDIDVYKELSPFLMTALGELDRADLFEADSDYDGMLGEAVWDLLLAFDDANHSGFSAMLTADIFHRLVRGETLTPLTDNPDEWIHIAESDNVWQSCRDTSCFSTDGGVSYYDIDEDQGRLRRFLLRHTDDWWFAKHHMTEDHRG